jgi:cyanophycin synthetase
MMDKINYQWLPHLEDVIPDAASGDKLSMYSIALEGWRRGLSLTFYNVKRPGKVEINYLLRSNTKEHKFAVSKGDKVPVEAMRIGRSKTLTKECLAKAGVPVPKGRSFAAEINDEDILAYADTLTFPVVLKPTNGNLGKGVISNITSKELLADALVHVRQELNYPEVIVEQFMTGEEYRIYILDGQVLAATNRIPANVIGDGKNSIKELILLKNKERRKNPNFKNRSIKIDQEVEKHVKAAGYTLDSILQDGERLFLRAKSNISTGGEPIDVTDELTEEIKNIAINTGRAVEGLVQGGIDVIVNKENNTGSVIEINTRPGIGLHLFPMEGIGRDLPKAIIDYYFPETIPSHMDELRRALYFDFDLIFSALKSGMVDEIVVPPMPLDMNYSNHLIISGKVQNVGYRNWVQNRALELHLHGYVENLPNGYVSIVAAGKQENVKALQSVVRKKAPARAKVEKVRELEWYKPIKVGFEIKQTIDTKKLDTALRSEKKKNKELQGRLDKLTKQSQKQKNTKKQGRSWRSLIRKLIRFLKQSK